MANKNALIIASAAVASAAAGMFAGYTVAMKTLEKRYNEEMAAEVERTKEFYAKVHKTEYPTPEDAVNDLIVKKDDIAEDKVQLDAVVSHKVMEQAASAMTRYRGDADELGLKVKTLDQSRTEAEAVIANVFAEQAGKRQDPYIISDQDFFLNEPEHDQSTLTYYAGGEGCLMDEIETEIPDDQIDNVIGRKHLTQFGNGSNDENVVYVRNELLGHDYEITRTDVDYKTVAGFTD